MKQEWLKPFFNNKGKVVGLRGHTSCSRSPHVALGFALDGIAEDQTPTLFIKCMKNSLGVQGIMMNSEIYSSYPDEGEMLLTEGIPVTILDYKKDVEINNKHASMQPYFGKKITIIFCMNY